MKSIVMLNAVTRRERNAATSFVFDSINRLGGWVDDVRLYSNKMTNIRLVLKEKDLGTLLNVLTENKIAVDAPAEMFAAGAEVERMATLQLTFIHDEPDLKREVPAVPG